MTSPSEVAYLALGSNLGDRHEHLAAARDAIRRLPQSRVLAESPVEETAPVGVLEQPAFLNQMIALETSLEPLELLDALQSIENSRGRERTIRWGPRTLDIDIVLFDRQSVNLPRLRVPHPQLAHRPFWQRELALLGRKT
ncbi:MAG TPA: 2-amino-4-hydroxy-6-hydroxymethyldihydropteridine diphosphokinase [Gemmatimonadales bacterium]|nr:2-amino-4-hydroxy-6-hydroxymethyldihydropteridine diphosphokinase [Gemmatimonadales bacterium]